MSLAAIRELLALRTGLQAETLGAGALPRAVAERLRVTGISGEAEYSARLPGDAREFQALIDSVVVPETWFFRGGPLYDAIVRQFQFRRLAGLTRPLRILSLPCSTGEEPYSLAMVFVDNGLSVAPWTIDAVDLCSVSIGTAKLGQYREFSFRETPAEIRSRHFIPAGALWELSPAIRSRVRFRVGNLFDLPATFPDAGQFDFVLCRNLLIYLTPAARTAALATLERWLGPDGWLGIGHAEAGNLYSGEFETVGGDGTFLFRRKSAGEPKSERISKPTGPLSGSIRPAAPRIVRLVPTFAVAKALADAGQLAEALVECQRVIGAAPSADAFSLLGTLLGATGRRAAAREAFRNAIYLDSHHRDSLLHGALLAEADGDMEQSNAYRARLARVTEGGG